MKWTLDFIKKLENKGLELAGHMITIDEIYAKDADLLRSSSKKIKIANWWERYKWDENNTGYEKWLLFIEKEMRKLCPKDDDEKIESYVKALDSICSPMHTTCV